MPDPIMFRQTANNIGRIAGQLVEQAFMSAEDIAIMAQDLATLKAAADICRSLARRLEALAAQTDEKAPLCLGCRHRKDTTGGLGCALALDTREAVTKRTCKRYDAE